MADKLTIGWAVWVGMNAENFAQQFEYYRDVVGMDLITASPDYASFNLGTPNAMEMGPLGPNIWNATKGFVVGFHVENIADVRQSLIDRGANAISDIKQDQWGNQWCYFQDPEGNVFCLNEPKPRAAK